MIFQKMTSVVKDLFSKINLSKFYYLWMRLKSNKYVNKIIKQYNWGIKQTWPISLIPLLIFSHLFLRFIFSDNSNKQLVDLYISSIYQIMGGVIILFEINSNIKIIDDKNILTCIKNWFLSNPLFLKPKHVTSTFSCVAKVTIGASGIKKEFHDSLEDKIDYIERQIQTLNDKINDNYTNIINYIDQSNTQLMNEIKKINNDTCELNKNLRATTTAGAKHAILGVSAVIYGLLIPVLFSY